MTLGTPPTLTSPANLFSLRQPKGSFKNQSGHVYTPLLSTFQWLPTALRINATSQGPSMRPQGPGPANGSTLASYHAPRMFQPSHAGLLQTHPGRAASPTGLGTGCSLCRQRSSPLTRPNSLLHLLQASDQASLLQEGFRIPPSFQIRLLEAGCHGSGSLSPPKRFGDNFTFARVIIWLTFSPPLLDQGRTQSETYFHLESGTNRNSSRVLSVNGIPDMVP